jgi:F0F1-type ATP synthase assembly protein I
LNLREYGKYIQFGSQLGFSMALPILAGYWLDSKLDTSPWLLITGIFLGAASSVWTVLKLAIDLNTQEKLKKNKNREDLD